MTLLWGTARADDSDAQRARAHYTEAVKHYDLGEFADALREFKEAYRVRQDPALLYNIGQSYWKLGDFEAAVHAYRAYLRQAGRPANASNVEARIRDLERRIANGESRPYRAAAPATEGAKPTEPPATQAIPSAPTVPTAPPMAEPASVARATAEPAPAEPSRSWMLWAGAGALVVGAVVIGVLLASGGDAADPVRGNVQPGLVNLTP